MSPIVKINVSAISSKSVRPSNKSGCQQASHRGVEQDKTLLTYNAYIVSDVLLTIFQIQINCKSYTSKTPNNYGLIEPIDIRFLQF